MTLWLEQVHFNAIVSSKALLTSVLTTGQIDYQAVSNTSNNMGTIFKLIDCIRREIQVITSGQ